MDIHGNSGVNTCTTLRGRCYINPVAELMLLQDEQYD
jgi:hypothetical protein